MKRSVGLSRGLSNKTLNWMPLMFSETELEMQHMAGWIFNESVRCSYVKALPNQMLCVESAKRWRGVGW